MLTVLALVVFTSTVLPSHALPSGIGGTVYWYDQYGNLHPFSWVQVSATSQNGVVTTTSSTMDGTYVLWVVPGTYNVTASSDPAFIPQAKMVTVSDGGVAAGVDFELQSSGRPIPEYPAPLLPILLLVTIAGAAAMIRRRVPQGVL